MKMLIRLAFAFAIAGMIGSAAAAGQPGREIYERHCRTCHGGTAPPDSPLGPSLVGIIGKKAGTQDSGVHSRAVIDSGMVWTRDSLRRFLAEPSRAIPGTLMAASITNPTELESLLEYLESLR